MAPSIGPSAKIQLTPKPLPVSSHFKARSTTRGPFKDRVRVSDEMAAKVVEIPRGKPKLIRADNPGAPRGYFSADGKTYPYYGLLTSHVVQGGSWDESPDFERLRLFACACLAQAALLREVLGNPFVSSVSAKV